MAPTAETLRVFYDGSCPSCIRDRRQYEKLAGRAAGNVEWVDITGRDEELQSLGIHPDDALQELHVQDSKGHIHRELDAYILLMSGTGAQTPGVADRVAPDPPSTGQGVPRHGHPAPGANRAHAR